MTDELGPLSSLSDGSVGGAGTDTAMLSCGISDQMRRRPSTVHNGRPAFTVGWPNAGTENQRSEGHIVILGSLERTP